MEYDFKILGEHYKRVAFVPRKRYTFMTPFRAFNYPDGFVSEYEFRRELFRTRPLFIANAPPDNEVVIDIDYRIDTLEEARFEEAMRIASLVANALDYVIPIKNPRLRFSGRGVHLVAETDVLVRAIELREEFGIQIDRDPRALLNKYIYYGLAQTVEWKDFGKYIDKSNIAGNKIYRTPGSINDKTMLPVVEFRLKERVTLEKILNAVTKPRTFYVVFTRSVRFRSGNEFGYGRVATVDEYEFLRLVIKNNYFIERFRVV